MNIVKISLILVLGIASYAQEVYTIKNKTLKEAIETVSKKANLPFIVDASLIKGKQSPNINSIEGVQNALDAILEQTNLKAIISNKTIIIKEIRTNGNKHQSSLGEITVHGMKNSITENSNSYSISSMNTATKMDLSILETPQTVSVVTREKMDDFSLTSINDVLSFTPGVTVEKVETDRTKYTARGFDVTNFQIDGVNLPLNFGVRDGTVDTAIYDHIEITKGATGLMSGAGDPSATVNMKRKRPTQEAQHSVSLETGSWNKKRGVVDISGPLSDDKSLRARMVLVHENSESYLDRYETHQNLIYAIIEKELNDTTLLTTGFSYEKDQPNSPMWGALPLYYKDGSATNYDVSTNSAPDWAYRDTTKKNFFAELSHQLQNEWEVKSIFNFNNTEQDSNLLLTTSNPESTSNPSVTTTTTKSMFNEKEQFVDLFIKGPYEVMGLENEAVFGFSWAKKHTLQKGLYDNTTGNGKPTIPDLSTWNGSTPQPTFEDGERTGDFTTEQFAIYASTNFHLTEQLSLLTGARFSNWETIGESYGRDYTSKDVGIFTPYIGSVYNITDSLATYASYTTSFVPQEKVDINSKQIKPTESVNYEIGLKKEFFDGSLFGTLAFFKTVQDNATETAGTLANGQKYYSTHDGIVSKGYELELFGEITKGLNASIGYTNFTIKDQNGAVAKTYIPKQQFKFASTYQFQTLPALKVGASVNWQDDIFKNQTNATVGPKTGELIVTKQKAYSIINLMSDYKINKNLTATLNINNLTNEKYLNSLSWPRGYYGSPRAAYLTLKWNF